MNEVLRVALRNALWRAILRRAILIFTDYVTMTMIITIIMSILWITLRIARPRNALWRAILRRAILSMSFIRIARPIYFVFFCVEMPFK